MSDFNEQIIKEFRANDGKVGGRFADTTLLLMHTTGAKSGKEHVNPLVTFKDNGRLVVVASKGGAPSHPDWYYNILANPVVEVEYGTEKFKARASETEEPERTELYERMEDELASFKDYKKTAGRVIPVLTLSPLEE
jgi:deazaflavin-dependent oxidoreductase (nitroreductase family)